MARRISGCCTDADLNVNFIADAKLNANRSWS